MVTNYNYRDVQSDIKSIIHAINLLYKGPDVHPNGLVGAEIGVYKADSFMTILHNCPYVKKLHGVDAYKPYSDYLKDVPDGHPSYSIDEKEIEFIKLTSYHHQKYSGCQDRIVFHEMDSNDAAKEIEDDSLDFIFLDACMTGDQAYNDIEVWYPKVKSNGLFAGHDWNSLDVKHAVLKFRRRYNITPQYSTYDDTWAWIK
tara:strand:+ start:2401 stop:3000 length:600 start_codon:yes stop_codon:yes gene_type:complete